jgi:fructose-1,6-bisphosphatase
MPAEIPRPRFDYTCFGGSDWSLVKYHLEFLSETKLLLGNNRNLLTEWYNQQSVDLHFEEPIPEDEYICMVFSTGIYLKNKERLMNFLQICCDYDNDDFVQLEEIVGLNTRTFLSKRHSSNDWEVGYLKKD